jgi:solute carrier family 25 (mitochondrial citrate transporter), member 1
VGAIEISCTYPTEYVKTVMQLDKTKQKLGAFGVVGETFKQRGFFGFYRGYSSLLVFNMPKNSVRFYTYEYAATNIFKEKTVRNNFLCGLVAGAMEAVLVVTPQETIKTKLIHDRMSAEPKYKNLF